MDRLGYTRYVAQGGDWGGVIATEIAKQQPRGLLGIHVNFPQTVPPGIARSLQLGEPPPVTLSDVEERAYRDLETLYKSGTGYARVMGTRPQTIGYSFADSPVGLAAWFYDKFAEWTHSGGEPERALTRDAMLDDITLYWLTNTGASSARLYWEYTAIAKGSILDAQDIAIPTAVTVFPGENYRAPKSWAERAYRKLIYFHEVEKGGHFAAWEQPELFAEEIRAGFRPLRTR